MAFILYLLILVHFSLGSVYINKDADENMTVKIQKEYFAKKEFVFIGQIIQSCLINLTFHKEKQQAYVEHKVKVSVCVYRMSKERNLTFLTSNNYSELFSVKHMLANLHLVGQFNDTALKIFIKLPSRYRIELQVEYFRLPYREECGHGWLAYQDSDGQINETTDVSTTTGLFSGCYQQGCLKDEFNSSGSVYGRYCGSLIPWTFHSTANYIEIMMKIWINAFGKGISQGRVDLFYQPFTLSKAKKKHIILAFYTIPIIHENTNHVSLLDHHQAIFYKLQLQTLPGFIITLSDDCRFCEYYDGPSLRFPKIKVYENVSSSGHIMLIFFHGDDVDGTEKNNRMFNYSCLFSLKYKKYYLYQLEKKDILVNGDKSPASEPHKPYVVKYNINSLLISSYINFSLLNFPFQSTPSMNYDHYGFVLWEVMQDSKPMIKTVDSQLHDMHQLTRFTTAHNIYLVIYSYTGLDMFHNSSITVSLTKCPGVVMSLSLLRQVRASHINKLRDNIVVHFKVYWYPEFFIKGKNSSCIYMYTPATFVATVLPRFRIVLCATLNFTGGYYTGCKDYYTNDILVSFSGKVL